MPDIMLLTIESYFISANAEDFQQQLLFIFYFQRWRLSSKILIVLSTILTTFDENIKYFIYNTDDFQREY